ncbi:basic proline-rich protein-like [Gorilla gorilla gorilla]|uniref:basic proline-rich protein-like n=1 Tax=Gorilla gorilla gorilla TaxID=9595 RepID=UPI00300A3BA7
MARAAAAAARCPGSRTASGRVPRAPRGSPSVSPPPPPPAFRSRGARPRPLARQPGSRSLPGLLHASAAAAGPTPPAALSSSTPAPPRSGQRPARRRGRAAER